MTHDEWGKMVESETFRVPASKLRWRCEPDRFTFLCTDDIAPLEEFVGQDRALRAIEFGLSVHRPGYNIFASGLTGTGKTTVIQQYLQQAAAARAGVALPDDWCYVYSDANPDRPTILRLPRGRGRELRDHLTALLARLRKALPEAFHGEDYRKLGKQAVDAGQDRRRAILTALDRRAREAGFLLQGTPSGVAVVPMLSGQPVTDEQFLALPEPVRTDIEAKRAELLQQVEAAFEEVGRLEAATSEQIRTLNQQVAEFTVGRPFAEIEGQFGDQPDAVDFLKGVRAFTLRNVELFLQPDGAPSQPADGKDQPSAGTNGRRIELSRIQDPFIPFRVNLFVDHSGSSGPPIVVEPNPTWGNVFGKLERRAFMGAYFSDHTMLKPGALALANGGYLILNGRDVLINPGVWEGLKRALRTKEARLEDPAEQMGMVVPVGLRPQPLPLDVKVIMTGDFGLYQLLARADEDFWEIFKVQADFDTRVDRTDRNLDAYASFICATCQRDGLVAFDRDAVCRVAEFGARLAGDQRKLTARFGLLRDVLIETDYWTRRAGAPMAGGAHVRQALEARVYRSSLIAERMRELIAEGTIFVEVAGAVVGQVNGLAVYDLGTVAFGRPSRITARTFMGRDGVVNIERVSQLSGPTHDKGVLILAGYLGATYAQDRPLALTATLTFEQSYEGVEGDSASSTELYAILSSLADLPVRQGLAVTGSVNQRGSIQPIGGVNEKIEGYFDVCRLMGLTGEQGAIIPESNVPNLNLREDVVEAVERRQFHVYAVRTVDEGIALLTGVPAGARDETGQFPEGTVHARVEQQVRRFADGLRTFSQVH
ncbi:MAG: AAA family ATPase [Chloroflexi bacterium]|nr:AAA family ATPase [Chloroflexota bacterium]